jgi:hypothetical protein
MSIVLVGSTSGSITLQEPAVAGSTTISLPATTGTVVLQNGSNNLLMNSGYGSDAVAYGCRAWVNFNGTGTVAISSSGNVSSITDVGVGQYTVNLTNSMPDANYSVGVNTDYDGVGFGVNAKNFASGSFSVQCILPNLSNYTDHSLVNCQVFR